MNIDKKAALRDMMNGVRSPEAMKFVQTVKVADGQAPAPAHTPNAVMEHHDRPIAGANNFKDFGSFEAMGASLGISSEAPVQAAMYSRGPAGGYPSIDLGAIKNLVGGKKEEPKAPALQEKIGLSFKTPRPEPNPMFSFDPEVKPTKELIKENLGDMKSELKELIMEVLLDEIMTGDRMEKFVMKTVLKVLKTRSGK